MMMRLPENSFEFTRRLAVRWSALSWRPQIVTATPLLLVWTADDYQEVVPGRRPVCLFRPSSKSLPSRSAARVLALKPTFFNLPRPRVNISSTTDL